RWSLSNARREILRQDRVVAQTNHFDFVPGSKDVNTFASLAPLVAVSPAVFLPLAALAGALLVFAILWLRHVSMRRRFPARFEESREDVIQFREKVEAVRERHKLLPATDDKGGAVMAGTTLNVYRKIQTDASALWNDWLRRMDLWDRVQLL